MSSRSLVFEVDPARPDEAGPALSAAAAALGRGELVAFPTDTVYALACRPDDPAATARLFRAKRRRRSLSLPVLAGSHEAAWDVAIATEAAVLLGTHFWPGPLTLVLGRTERSGPWELGNRTASVAVRVPDHPLSLSLLGRAGPLAATSANRSGQPPAVDVASLRKVFDGMVAVYLVASPRLPPLAGAPSTVVDLTGERPEVLREGALEADRVLDVLAGSGFGPTG